MRVLIVHTVEQDGYDTLIPQLASTLTEGGHAVTTLDSSFAVMDKALDEVYDMVLLINATRWHLKNRIKYKGRPWICCANFVFDDLCTVLEQGSVMDVGAQCYLSNCVTFIQQVSSVMLGSFCWKPIPVIEPKARTNAIGCVLPNVADRDFCLLDRTLKVLKEAGKEQLFRLYVRDTEKARVPDVLEPYVKRYAAGQESDAYQSLNGYIIAPRITDYRAGVVPTEIFRAIAWGCLPLTIYHPALGPILQCVEPIFKSLTEFDQAVRDMAAGAEPVKATLSSEHSPTPAEFVETVMSSYTRSKNAPTGRIQD